MSKIDKLFSRCSHVSQVLLVLLAFFGYFYTVRPIYQKELLAEKISEKQIELNKIQSKAEQLNSEVESKKSDLIKFRKEMGKRFAILFVATLKLDSMRSMVSSYPKLASNIFFGELHVGIAYDMLVSPYEIIDNVIISYKNSSNLLSRVLPNGVIEKFCVVADNMIIKEHDNLLQSIDIKLLKSKIRGINKRYRGVTADSMSSDALGIGYELMPSAETKTLDFHSYGFDPELKGVIQLIEQGSSNDFVKISRYFDLLLEQLLSEIEKGKLLIKQEPL